MGFWFYMLAVCLLIPGIMVCAGYFMAKHPPKKINFFIGYRTSLSMKNEDTWRFAHDVAGRFWMKWGAITLLVSVLPMLAICGQEEKLVCTVGLILSMLQLVPLLAVVSITERALRRVFHQDGRRKSGN